MKKMVFIYNPATGGGKLKSRLMEILCRFSAAGYEVTVYPTAAPGDARDRARKKAPEVDLIVCCGGDGTLNEVVNGMLEVPKPPPLGYIPGGTTNDFASSLQLPKSDMLRAVDRILAPKRVFQCDVGSFNERIFTYVAAFGAFSDVSYTTPQVFKNVVGYLAYVVEALSKLPNLRSFQAKVKSDGGEAEEDFIFGMVTNSASVAGIHFPEKAAIKLDDGVFEVLLVRRPQSLAELGELSSALMTRNFHCPCLTAMRVKQLAIVAEEPIAWTLDGEFGGEQCTVDIHVKQKALKICV